MCQLPASLVASIEPSTQKTQMISKNDHSGAEEDEHTSIEKKTVITMTGLSNKTKLS